MASRRRRRTTAEPLPDSGKPCIDCASEGITTRRKTSGKPALCATHRRARRTKRSSYSHEKHILETYNLTPDQYWAIYEAQGRRCAICRRATGAKRRLSVDHDHACCSGPTSCGKCVRSLCCTTCNKMLGHIRDDLEIAERIVLYLLDPPGKEVLSEWCPAQ